MQFKNIFLLNDVWHMFEMPDTNACQLLILVIKCLTLFKVQNYWFRSELFFYFNYQSDKVNVIQKVTPEIN